MKHNEQRTTNVSISLPQPLRDAARQAAFDDNRSFSSLVAWLLKEHLQREGYLEERRPVFRLRTDRLLSERMRPPASLLGNSHKNSLLKAPVSRMFS